MEKKRIYAFVVPLCIVMLLGAVCWWGYKRLSFQEEQADVDLYTLVPTDCEALLETKDIDALQKSMNGAHYIRQHGVLKVSDLLNLLANHIGTLAKQQAHGLSTEMNRQLLVSFHQPGSTHDQVIYGRLGNGDIGSINRLMQQSTGTRHAPKRVTYKGEEIVIYPLGRDFLACYFKPGFFAVSLQKRLIEKVIDAYTTGKALGNVPAFHALHKQTKHNEHLALYLPTKGDSGNAWQHVEIRLGAEAIYLTGNHAPGDTCQWTNNNDTTTLIERTDGALLPKQVLMMEQKPFCAHADMDAKHPTLAGVLAENDCGEVTTIVFAPTLPDTATHQLLMLPLTTDQAERVKQALRYPMEVKRRPSIRTPKAACPTWQCTGDTTLYDLFIQRPHTTESWLAIYRHHLLVSARRETLQSYIMGMEDEVTPSSAPANHEAYADCLSDLAEQANYTLVADMNDIVNHHPDIIENGTPIPDFFFKHKDFFKHFMLATQHISNGGQVNTQVILTYQGDSIRHTGR